MLIRSRGITRQGVVRGISEEPPAADSFFFRVFYKNIAIANSVLYTEYLQAIKEGVLPPDNYGQLTVLDAFYCYRGADTYATALTTIDKNANNDLYLLMKELYTSYVDYNKTFFDYWHIRTAESVNPTQNFIDYSEHEHHVAYSEHAIYTLVAMLPCYYLWYWFSDRILETGIKEDNLYYEWVENCHSAGSAYQIGNFIELWKKQDKEFDEAKAMEIYATSMNYELKVFTDAYKTQQLGGNKDV